MQNDFRHVCSPIKIGSVEIPNRIYFPPMGTNFAETDGSAGERLIRYYAARAEGGAGLITTEGVAVSHVAGSGLPVELALHDGCFIPPLRDLTDAVHEHGAKVSIQLHHPGRQALRIANKGATPVAPSPIPCPVCSQIDVGVIPKELTVQEIEVLIDEYAQAAFRAKLAGFDVVELHGAHGYLIAQFMSPLTNKRNDAYGGSFEKRMLFPVKIVEKIKELADDFPIIFRMSADEGFEGGITVEITKEIARSLERAGVSAISISSGFYPTLERTVPPIYFSNGWLIPAAEEIKKVVNIPVIGTSRIPNLELAEEILAQGKVDMVGMGRALIADPQLVKKSLAGQKEDIRPCIYCNFCAFDRLLSFMRLRCAVNANAGSEYIWRVEKTAKPKNVLVVGGGPGGAEAARIAAFRGHRVKLVEENKELGGQLKAASAPSFKQELKDYMNYLSVQVRKAGVEVELGKKAGLEDIIRWSPDAVVVATGSTPYMPKIKGVEKAVTAIEVLKNIKDVGAKVVIVGGGYVGCETALCLAERGKQVTLVEMLHEIAADVGFYEKKVLEAKMKEKGIEAITGRKMVEILEKGIIAENDEGNRQTYSGDTIILAVGVTPNRDLAEALRGKVREVYEIGDCTRPGRVHNAIHNAAFVANRI